MKKKSHIDDTGEFVEHRRYRRFRFDQGSFYVSADPSFKPQGQLVDLSQGGLSFRYEPDGDTTEAVKIHIIGPNGEARVSDLTYLNVSDFEVASRYPFPAPKWRRRGIRFSKLTMSQLNRIMELIRGEIREE